MTDPRFRTVYKSLADAPKPDEMADGFWIAVEVGGDELQDYVTKGGQYIPEGRRYVPAVTG